MTEMLERPALDTSWMQLGLCLNEDPETFWLDSEVDDAHTREKKMRAARRVCDECPVQAECLLWGLLEAPNDHWSILGGLTHRQRRTIRREVGWS